jgi:hypothetical protein
MTTFTITSVASPLQVTKLMDKPVWAGKPGGPNGDGDGDDPTTTYVLHIEIDYMDGHEPTPLVLDYIVNYYGAKGISVTFYVDGYPDESEISEEVPLIGSHWDATDGISDDEFDVIETMYNDNDNGYDDNWKWVLFGTTVEGESDVVGYCWVIISGKDYLAGNYIFIADEEADSWASSNGIELYGTEAAVLMHEMGHSIGIGILHPRFGEKYDPDPSSVMSYLTPANAGHYEAWYYSDGYWATRNMDYYEEEISA